MTKRLIEAGKLLDIPLIDHIVIGAGRGAVYSFKDNHPEMFEGSWDLSVFPELYKTAEAHEDYIKYSPDKRTSVIERLKEKKAETEKLPDPKHVEIIEKLQDLTHPNGMKKNGSRKPREPTL